MPILEIAQIGNPIIRANSATVEPHEISESSFQTLIDDMIETMRHAGGVGIAAPQVNVGKRLFAIEVRNPDLHQDVEVYPLTIVINPELTYLSPADAPIQSWEGCLSVAGLRGQLPRFKRVLLEGLDRKGGKLLLELEGFPAIVAQHETDHLNGNVYLDRMPDMLTLCFESEYRKFHPSTEEVKD